MADALHWIGGGLTVMGALLTLVGAAGVLRFPDVYTRIHAASITDTGGATLMLLGLGLMSGGGPEALKLAVAWLFLMLTGPTASHALAHAAHASGHTPWVGAFRIIRSHADEDAAERGDESGGRGA